MILYDYDNENKKECEGCTVRDICILIPSYIDPKTNEVTICPCVECIVKPICNDASTCEKYQKHYDIIYDLKSKRS